MAKVVLNSVELTTLTVPTVISLPLTVSRVRSPAKGARAVPVRLTLRVAPLAPPGGVIEMSVGRGGGFIVSTTALLVPYGVVTVTLHAVTVSTDAFSVMVKVKIYAKPTLTLDTVPKTRFGQKLTSVPPPGTKLVPTSVKVYCPGSPVILGPIVSTVGGPYATVKV